VAKLTIVAGKRPIGARTVNISAGATKAIKLRLNRTGKQLLAKRRTLKVKVTMKVARGTLTTTRVLRMTLKR
jgi:hypothetical protein